MNVDGSGRNVPKVVRLTTALAVGAMALAGCSNDDAPKARPSAAPSPAAATNPLTGVGKSPDGPVVAVKLDDTAAGRPSLGVNKADVIYIVEVEGGLTRMLAVFASSKPKVRAVRSIRASDPELLGQYGGIILVASGGGKKALKVLDQSTLHSVINDRAQVGFIRDPSRQAPYNVVSDLAKVSDSVKADGPRNVGFSWATSDPRLAGAKPAKNVKARVGSTPVRFVWDAKLAAYVRTVDGHRVLTGGGAPVAKPNVLIQHCQIAADPTDRDTNGNPTMFTKSVGTGRVVLYRNGKRIEGTWSRPSLDSPTTFKDAAGKSLLFAPGGTFVALARADS